MKKSIFLFFAAILCAIGMNAATWTVAGDKEIVNGTAAWKQDETKNDLTNVSGTKWGLLVENKTLSQKSYYFKITKDHKWDTSYPGSNYDFKIGAAGTYNIIYRFNTSGTSVGADYFQTWTVAGSGTVLTDDWTPGATANDMTRNGNTFEYVLTKKNVKLTAGTNYECKVCKDHAWVTSYPGSNKKFSVSTTGNYDVIFTFNVATTDVTVTTTPVYTITASANPTTAGTITGAGTYAKDASVTLEATPNAGYKFVNWTVGGVEKSTDAKYSFTASADVTAVANFELSDPEVPTYVISVSANEDAMGTVTGAGDYTEGSPVTLTATPNTGYRFVNWTIGSEVKSTETTYLFTASEALTIVANFEAIPKYDITVKAVVPEAWTSATIGIHYWGDGISGTSTPVATEKEGNWNKYTIKDVLEGQSVNVIFLNGTSWGSDKSKQTANILDITEDKCFQISAKTLDGEGKCTFTEVDCAADIKPEGDVYTIKGASELGLSWDLTKTGNDMTKQTDGTYTLVKEGLDLATTGNYEYKVVKNHSWDWSIPSGNTNQTLKVDKDGTYTITFTLSADKKKLTADAECTAEKEVILDCFVAGTTNLVGGTSDFTDELPMTYDEGTKTYSKTFTALAAGNYQMKVVYGSDWLGYDKLAKPIPANVTEGDDKKIKFSLAEAGDVTVTYNVEKGIGLTGNFAVPNPPVISYVLMGVDGDWTTGIPMTQNPDNADEYMLLGQAISATDAVKVVKLVDGEKSAFCGKAQVKDGSADCTGDGDDNIVLAAGIYDFYYKVTDNNVFIKASIAVAIRTGLDVGQWGTLCPTQNVENPTGATFYQIAYLEEKDDLPFNMHFNEVTGTLQAGQPYFFIASATEIKGVKSGEVKTEGVKINGFCGYIGAEAWTLPYQESFDVNNDNTFVIWKNSVFRINAETSIKSERCYIIINKTQPSRDAVSVPAGARRITMGVSGINGQNTATGMENVDASAQPVKTIINGQLYILRGEKMYDAQGKLVK